VIRHTNHLTGHNRDALTRAYNHDLIRTRDELPDIMTYLEPRTEATEEEDKKEVKEAG
jgi:hypothetical protein